MNAQAQECLRRYNVKHGYGLGVAELIETLRELDVVYETLSSKHRWWNEYWRVADVEGTLVGYIDAETTGDFSAKDKGYEFIPDTICIAYKRDKIETVYEVKRETINE